MAEELPTPGPRAPDRRRFLRTALWGSGLAGAGGLAGVAAHRLAGRPAAGSRPPLGREFTYDVSRFQTSDPSLIRWRELGRFASGLERPRHLALTPDGSVLVCGDGGIRRFEPDGRFLGQIDLEGPVHSVACLPDGRLLAGRPGRITALSASGVPRSDWRPAGDELLPTSIAVAGDEVFVADARERVVLRLGRDGRPRGEIGRPDPARGLKGFVVPSPYFTVRMAPDGLLRITNPGEHRIEAWTRNGDFEISWGRASYAVEGFCGCCNPVSIELFPDGGCVTCEKGLPRVKTYDVHGEFTGLVAGPESFPEYVRAAQAGTPQAASAGIYAAVDAGGRVVVLDAIGGTVRTYVRKEAGDG